MEETTILSNYGQPITYFGVAYTLTKEDNDKLSSIAKAIQDALGDDIYFAPRDSRHITIMNLTHIADGYKDQDVMRFFEEYGEAYKIRLSAIARRLQPFEVRFTQLKAGTSAIILRGQDQGQISILRDGLMDLPRLNGRVIDAGFIHSTQARYKKQVSVNEVRKRLGDIDINVSVTIDKIGLVRADASFSTPHVICEEFVLGR